jgi:glutamine synthetase
MSTLFIVAFIQKMLTIPLSVSFYKKHHRIHDSFILEYIWIDGRGNLRSKYRTAYPLIEPYTDAYIVIEDWNYDGSSTHQASTEDSEIALVPVAHYLNPFFEPGRAFLILCKTYRSDGSPTETNFRHDAEKVFEKGGRQLDPWFGIEQEYFIMHSNGTRVSDDPLLFARTGDDFCVPEPQGDYYCGVGTRTVALRKLAEKHYEYCLNAGLKISGINAEVAPSQWEFQIGPCSGISAGDEVWVARYILEKLSEEFGVCISFKPKPVPNPWNSSGLHTNFSTEESRDDEHRNAGLKCIYKYIDRLSKKHAEHIRVYGDNSNRLNGTCETSDFHAFSYAAGDRGASVRIPKSVLKAGCGYLEDRRPASDADPYRVVAAIFSTACIYYQNEADVEV